MGRIGKKQNGSRSKTVTKLHLVWVPLEIKEKKTISRSLLLVDRENSVGFSAMSLAIGNLAPKLKKLKIKLHKEVEYTYEVGEDKSDVVRGIETENRKWRFQIFAAKKAIGVCPSWTDLNSDASALTKIFANVKKFHKNVDSSSYISDGVYALERKIQGTTHYEFIGIEKLNIEDADTETKGKKNEKEKKTEKSKKDDKDKKDVKEKDCDIPWNEDRKKLAEKLDDLVSKKKKELNIEIDGKSSDGSDSGSDSDSDSDSDSESSSSSSSSSASSSSSSSSCEKKKKKKKKNAAKKKGAKKVKKSNKKKK